MFTIEIRDVQMSAGPRKHLHGGHIDLPKAGTTSDIYSVEIKGWALGKSAPVASIEVLHEGRPVLELPISEERTDVAAAFPGVAGREQTGFWGALGGLSLRREFEVVLRAKLESGQRELLGSVRGEREQLRSDYEPLVQPLMVTTLGRSGSTWLNHVLSCHPQIVAFGPFKHETRVATYWATVLQELSQPESYLSQFDPRDLTVRRWWLGDAGVETRVMHEPGVGRWLGLARVRLLAATCQAQIDAFYAEHGAAAEQVEYFVEKCSPWQVPLDLLHELYPKAKEIILVRDFRDMFCSIRAYNEKRGMTGFQRGGDETDAEYIASSVSRFAEALLKRWRSREATAKLLRYEDLILEPRRTLTELAEYLEIESAPDTMNALLDRISRPDPASDVHRTTPDATASIGRWRRDLSPELVGVFTEVLDPLLGEFGYETGILAAERPS
jgi:Sulfotransferase family